jgi:TolB-like protein/DNA-binding winged helix-turn-helix (wHTH) protein/Tfp pilus assembly protein PilF
VIEEAGSTGDQGGSKLLARFSGGLTVTSQPIRAPEAIRFGDGFEFDIIALRLRCRDKVLKLERIPLEVLALLLERPGEIVSREAIVAKVWGNGHFLDTDNSIRGAIRKIRRVLNDDAEEPRFIQTVTGQGYRFIAPVVRPDQQVRADASDHLGPAETGLGNGTAHSSRPWLVVPLAILALLSVLALVYLNARSRPAEPKIRSIAVLPLKNLSGDPNQEYLADGMTEALITRLSRIRELRVISRTSVMPFKDKQTSIPQIAETLHVDGIVEGSVIREGSRIRVTAQLIRAQTDEHLWSDIYDRELRDALSLQSDVAQAIAEKVEVTVTGEERKRIRAVRSVAPEVYESYLKGRFTLSKSNTKGEIEQSIRYFEEATKKDAMFAPAYVGIADAYIELSTIFVGVPADAARPKAFAAAQKVLELDPEIAEAHVVLADIQQTTWHWSEAEAEYRRALELNSNNTAAHEGLALWLLCEGRIEEALAAARHARELDPVGVSGTGIAWILFQARRYDEAARELRSELAVRPDNATALWFLGFVLIAKDRADEAIPVLEKTASIMRRSPGSIEILATAHARAGHRAEALRLIDELKKRRRTSYVPAGALINPYLGLRDYDQAFFWFEEAFKEQSNILQFLKVHPYFDPVRGDPRFKDLVHRVGLD